MLPIRKWDFPVESGIIMPAFRQQDYSLRWMESIWKGLLKISLIFLLLVLFGRFKGKKIVLLSALISGHNQNHRVNSGNDWLSYLSFSSQMVSFGFFKELTKFIYPSLWKRNNSLFGRFSEMRKLPVWSLNTFSFNESLFTVFMYMSMETSAIGVRVFLSNTDPLLSNPSLHPVQAIRKKIAMKKVATFWFFIPYILSPDLKRRLTFGLMHE